VRILIVDDHELIRRGMATLLKEKFKGVEIGQAEDAKAGLQAALDEDWDLVMADIGLPGRSGLELIQDIKRQKLGLPILVISGHSERDYALRALKLGASGFVSKASGSEMLVTAIQKILEGGRFVSPAVGEQLAGAVSGEATVDAHETLSNRELEVLKLIAMGQSIKEIGVALALSEKTVATYRARIAEKMGLASNVELTRYAMRHGLVD
jgi:DNA-binding NarL/FixJ family response regulator